MIYFTLLSIPTAATVSGYVRCTHVALAIPLSMLAYLPQCRKTAGGGGGGKRCSRSRRCKSRLDQCALCALAIQRNWYCTHGQQGRRRDLIRVRDLVVRLSCQRQRQRQRHTVEVPCRFTWSCLGLQSTEYLALALPSATVAASASSLESDSFMNNALGRMVRRGICPGRRA